LASLGRLDLNSLTADQRIDLLRVYAVAFVRMGKPDEASRARLVALFEPRFPAADHRESAELAQMIVYLEAPKAAEKLVAALQHAPTQEEEIDYARILRVLRAGWTPELRKQYFSWFARARSLKGGHSLAGFIKTIKVDAMASAPPAEAAAMKPLLEAAEKADPPPVFKPRPFVKKWTLDELVPLAETKLVGRDFVRGRRLFAEAKCFACHRFNFEGASAGPDLSALAGRFSKRDLLESIVDPSKTISDQYAAVVILTTDGETVTGRVVNHSGDGIMVMPDMLNPDGLKTVDAKKIEKIVLSKTSPMPAGLLDTLKEDEVLDLVAFLLSRGDSGSGMFKK
jgi:putative heme-binding domain-containing protein